MCTLTCKLDIKYGPDDMQSMDIFPINKPMGPILAFIHGGYWSSRSKSIGRFLAPFYTAAGVNFISIGYRLCPAVQIGSIVKDIRNCLDWIFENAGNLTVIRTKFLLQGILLAVTLRG